MQWRLIEQETFNAAMNMALDHAIYESVGNGRESPTIRFYKWKNNSVSIGAYQNQRDINIIECKKNNVDIVRRMTGGRAVYHDKVDFTYSFIAPLKIFDFSIKKAYSHVCQSIINALKDLGIESSLQNKNDIMVNNKKISGNAAKVMDKGIYLQHGTLIYDIDFVLMPKVLNINQELAKEKITSISQLKKISQKKIYETLKRNFVKGKNFKVEKFSEHELLRAEELVRKRYSDLEFTSGTLLKAKGACYVESGN